MDEIGWMDDVEDDWQWCWKNLSRKHSCKPREDHLTKRTTIGRLLDSNLTLFPQVK